MKLAIIAPSPVPYTIGGAEKLWWGLLGQFNRMSGVQAELIKLPSPERNFVELMASYRHFFELDLSHFDAVISTKYPAWMVQHPNHVVYLQHRLRGLYDTYALTQKPLALPAAVAANPHLQPLLALLAQAPDAQRVAQLFSLLQGLQVTLGQTFDSIFDFPGPLTRQVVHYLDTFALQPKQGAQGATGIQHYAAISHNVRQRQDYFPAGVPVAVIHHPSDLPTFGRKQAKHVFTVSRLDNAKRLNLLIQAYQQVQTDLPFYIAGTGPEFDALKQLAAGDSRIQLLGRLTDEQIIVYYQVSLFVPFVPYDEDYGLITIEAMQAGVAILTTTDAGGVNEFVEHEVSGLSVPPTVPDLAQAMQSLLDNPQRTLAMGQAAMLKVAHVSWPHTCNTLLQLAQGKVQPAPLPAAKPLDLQTQRPAWSGSVFEPLQPKPRMLVVNPFRVTPPQSGGQARVFYLYQALSQRFDVTILSVGGWQTEPATVHINSHYREVVVPLNPAARKHFEQIHRALQVDCDDVALIDGILLHHEFLVQLRNLAQRSRWVVASHPYLYKAIQAVHRGAVQYDAHNVESDMKAVVLGRSANTELAAQLLHSTQQLEAQLLQQATHVFACSQQDLQRFAHTVPSVVAKGHVVPNGVDMQGLSLHTFAAKAHAQSAFASHPVLQQQAAKGRAPGALFEIALFAGSWHGPNIQAMHHVVNMAQSTPHLLVLVMGSVGLHPDFAHLPPNVLPMGMVSEFDKRVLLQAATLLLNPMQSGSGTNLKMLEYAASGGTIITTEFGNRGLGFEVDQAVLQAPAEQFAQAVQQAMAMPLDVRQAMATLAFAHVQAHFDWGVCAQPMLAALG